MKFNEVIEVKSNLKIVARERGKIVDRRDTQNIFLDLGREWLSQLISYQSYNPDTFQRERPGAVHRVLASAAPGRSPRPVANSTPIGGAGDPYAANSAAGIGSNNQTDTDRTVTTLERPVRVLGGSSNYPRRRH